MITTSHTCSNCGSENIVRNGTNKSGSATYHCKDCKVYRVVKRKKEVDTEALARTYEERNSYRSTGRIFNISHVSVYNYLKKQKR